MTDTYDTAQSDRRIAVFAERLRKLIAGDTDAELEKWLEESLQERVFGGTDTPWLYDMNAERLECLLEEGHRIVDDMRDAWAASRDQRLTAVFAGA